MDRDTGAAIFRTAKHRNRSKHNHLVASDFLGQRFHTWLRPDETESQSVRDHDISSRPDTVRPKMAG